MSLPHRPRRVSGRGRALMLLVLSAAFAAACSDDTAPAAPREYVGSPVSVGQGTAQTVVTVTADGKPSIGVALTPAALDGLPTTDVAWDLPLPTDVTIPPPWDHVTIDWNPNGHPPAAYGLPHFDFHFYMVTPAAQATILGGPDTMTVPAAYVPRDYVSGVMSVPDMGVHWVDTTAAEFHGSTFDKTLIYGFHHGDMVFVEPMVTRAFLAGRPSASGVVKQPQSYQRPGAYPTTYSVRWDAASQTVRVSLDSLSAR